MTTIISNLLLEMPFSKVFGQISNLENYENWWKKYNTTYDKVTQTITFYPIPLIKFRLKFIESNENSISFNYINPFFRGVGIWNAKEISLNRTLVAYKIEIKGKNIISNHFVKSEFFKEKHNNDILELMCQLQQ